MATDEFQTPGRRGGRQSHNGLDLSAVEGGLTTRPASGVGPVLVSRSWSSARLTVELDVAGVGPRDLDATVVVDGREFPAEIRGEHGGHLTVEAEFAPRSVPSGTHPVRVRVKDDRGETATVDAGRVQIFGMMGDTAAETTATSGGEVALSRVQAAGAGFGLSVAGFVLGKIF